MRNSRSVLWLIASVFVILSMVAGSFPALAQDIVPAGSFSPAFTGQGIKVEPKTGNWNYPDKFRVTNITSKAIEVQYFLDCREPWESMGVCEDSDYLMTIILQAGESTLLGFGKICAMWQLDIPQENWGGTVEISEEACITPTPTPTTIVPTATATQVVTPTATATIPVVPTATATQVVTPTATPANTPVPSPTPTMPVTPENTPTSVPSVTPATPEPEVAYCKAGNFRLKPESFTALWPATANPEIVNRTSTTQVGMIDSNGQVVEITPQNEIWKFSFGFNPHLTYSVTVDGVVSDNSACQLKAWLVFLPSIAKSDRPAPTPEPTPAPTPEPEMVCTVVVAYDPVLVNLGCQPLGDDQKFPAPSWVENINWSGPNVRKFTAPTETWFAGITGITTPDRVTRPPTPLVPDPKFWIQLKSVFGNPDATYVSAVQLPDGSTITAETVANHNGSIVIQEGDFRLEIRVQKFSIDGHVFYDPLALQASWNNSVMIGGLLVEWRNQTPPINSVESVNTVTTANSDTGRVSIYWEPVP